MRVDANALADRFGPKSKPTPEVHPSPVWDKVAADEAMHLADGAVAALDLAESDPVVAIAAQRCWFAYQLQDMAGVIGQCRRITDRAAVLMSIARRQ
jgi:hypothetical protein